MPNEAREQLFRRIQSEYLEMPGLQLTRAQAQKLWALDEATCAAILEGLVDREFLVCDSDGRYKRAVDGRNVPLRMAKADLIVASKASRAR